MKFEELLQRCESELNNYAPQILKNPQSLNELEQIFTATEQHWQNYLTRLNRLSPAGVQYLLLTEAPPSQDMSTVRSPEFPRYVFNAASKNNRLLGNLCRMFVWEPPKSGKEKLDLVASHGVLVMDALPFALPYKTRNNAAYRKLVAKCFELYLAPRVENAETTWSNTLKIGIGYKSLGEALIAEKATLQFSTLKKTQLTRKHLAYCSTLPCPAALRETFGIPKPE
ncbi:hypothetical protein [Desulfobaculum bizertense]|uniref:Uncharacterized protein n=1 Tax=Desulfobaculum bizertense DSM 18034 TaxID=1121442 RepID=A0A1T4VSE2_9BACT|nr:hypothetical protein [Desulfobaculum bizertense]SKA67890.1 hypothetical protein SAMN02745702_00910 [Desulfobaculum bizertense DSM 18034]